MGSRLLPAVFMIVLVFVSIGDFGPSFAEARFCETRSLHFKGPCLSDTNCANVCHSERFPSGRCGGFLRRCMCQTVC